MLYSIALVAGIIWLLGLMTSYMMGGLIHIFLIVAIVAFAVAIIRRRKPL